MRDHEKEDLLESAYELLRETLEQIDLTLQRIDSGTLERAAIQIDRFLEINNETRELRGET